MGLWDGYRATEREMLLDDLEEAKSVLEEKQQELDAKDEKIRKLTEALQHYADHGNWDDNLGNWKYCQEYMPRSDGWKIAEDTLEEVLND